MAHSSYQYQSLSEAHSIRLLVIRHDESKPHSLSLSLQETNLDHSPEFCALSYTWKSPVYTPESSGSLPSPDRHFDVECDGKVITISENLFNFFQTVLQASERSGHARPQFNQTTSKRPKIDQLLISLPLWIDALCINQDNPREKQHQVLLMHKVYSCAKNVLVWLGASELDPRGSVVWVHNTFIPALAGLVSRDPRFVASHLATDPLCESREAAEKLGGAVCSRWTTSWLGFANFLDRHRWFDRGWIVQEVALSHPRNIFVLCGAIGLRWVRLSAFACFLHQTGWAQSLRTTLDMRISNRTIKSSWYPNLSRKKPIGWKIRSIEDIRRLIDVDARPSAEGSALDQSHAVKLWVLRASSLISILRSSQFEDHRDHVYGSLGMLSRLLPEGLQSPITPDYEKTAEEVFTSVAATFITETASLLELSQVEDRRHRRYHALPSWVPDYSVHQGDSYLRFESDLSPFAILKLGSTPLPKPVANGTKLAVHGIQIDIRGKQTLHCWRDDWRFREDLINLLRSASATHTTTMAIEFWDTLTHGRTSRFARSHATSKPESVASSPWSGSVTDMAREYDASPRLTAANQFGVSEHFLDDEWLSRTSQAIPFTVLAARFLAEDAEEEAKYEREQEVKRREAEDVGWYISQGRHEKYSERRTSFGWGYYNFMEFLKRKAEGSYGGTSVHALTLLGQLVQIDPVAPRLGSQRLEQEVWNVLSLNALCATVGGRLGLGPSSSVEGDEVWVLAGARAPFLLRRVSGPEQGENRNGGPSYRLVGEFYICGVDVSKSLAAADPGEMKSIVLV